MPVISRFYGITIKMYLRQAEHNPPHIHAVYGNTTGLFSIADADMYEGDIPPKEQKLIEQFIHCYQKDLYLMWETQSFKTLAFEKGVQS